MARRGVGRDAAEFAAAVLFEWIVQCFTLPAALALARRIGRLAFRVSRYPERSRRQISDAFPDWPEGRVSEVAEGCFASLAQMVVEAVRISRKRPGPQVLSELVEARLDERAMRQAREGGVLFVTAHLGSWTLAPWALAIHGVPIVSVARPLENRWLDAWIMRLRARQGQKVIVKKGALLALSRCLKEGLSVGLAVDQDARREGIFVPFFGKPASTYDGIAALALRYRRPIVPGYVVRKPQAGTFLAVMDAPIPADGLPDDPEKAKRELTARMNLRIEAYVREYPDQWIWHYNRWKTQPQRAQRET